VFSKHATADRYTLIDPPRRSRQVPRLYHARAARSAGAKGWRWVAEMEEIAASMAAAGLPEGFHQAAAEIYRRAPHDAEASLDAVLDALGGDKEGPGR